MLKRQFTKLIECGTDEAGRGSLAGPVTAAAVIFPKGYYCSELDDSKKISEKKREILRSEIIKNAIDYSVYHVSVEMIDTINIFNASILAMNKSIENLKTKPDFILVDGKFFETKMKIPYKCIIKGDATYMSIAAASILAKTSRDRYMRNLSKKFPIYQWDRNKGYPTMQHRNAIKNHGMTIHHRKSFKMD